MDANIKPNFSFSHTGVFSKIAKSSKAKARYVNDVNLPRFGGGRGATRPTIGRPSRNAALYGTATRNPLGLTGIQRISPPRTAGMIPQSAAARQWPRPPKLGARCPTLRTKTQIPRRVCTRGAESLHSVYLLRANVRTLKSLIPTACRLLLEFGR